MEELAKLLGERFPESEITTRRDGKKRWVMDVKLFSLDFYIVGYEEDGSTEYRISLFKPGENFPKDDSYSDLTVYNPRGIMYYIKGRIKGLESG